jgi:hypothetical protein
VGTFVNRIKERRENDRILNHLRYDDFRRMGYLQPITVRLPVTTLAKIVLLEKKLSEKKGQKVWDSRQEMIFEMIESCVRDWIATADSPDRADQEFQAAAYRALQQNPPVRKDQST